MEKPPSPNSIPFPQQTPNDKPKITQKKKIPSPQELISHYTTLGLDQEQASIKVIEDLQNVLFRIVASNNKNKKDKLIAESLKKIDVVNSRVALVDMKLDSKPGYVETLGLGISSGAAVNVIGNVLPQVVKGFGQIWNAVRTATDPSSTSSNT